LELLQSDRACLLRGDNGYRDYSNRDVEILRFIHRARSLGFSVQDVSNLLSLWLDRKRASADVKAVAQKHLEDIEVRIQQLESIRTTLLHLMERCHGDERPDCPILDELAENNDCH
jgi:Cu(I)-responsive transcriptional regulator